MSVVRMSALIQEAKHDTTSKFKRLKIVLFDMKHIIVLTHNINYIVLYMFIIRGGSYTVSINIIVEYNAH